MPYNLTDDEQTALMQAALALTSPYYTDRPLAIKWQEADGSVMEKETMVRRLRDDTPEAVRALADVVDDIIDRGFCIGGAF